MTKMTQGSLDDTKRTSELPTEIQLDALEWARDFMNRYERKHASRRLQ